MRSLSTIQNQSLRAAPAGAAYGLLQSGADWTAARGVLIVIHGRDRDGGELPAQLADMAARHGLRLLAPVAPRLAWYPGRYNEEGNGPGRDMALAQIEALMALSNEHGIPDSRIALVGFSQGACIATEYLLWGDRPPAGAAIFTGCALSAPAELPAGRLRGLHVLMTSGRADPWLALDDLFVAADALERAGAQVTRQIFSDADHVVRLREIELLEELIEHLLTQEQ